MSGLKWRRRRGHASISPASQKWSKWLDIIMGTIMFIFCPIPASLCVQKVSVMTVIDECAGGKAALQHYQTLRGNKDCSSGPGAAAAVMPASGTTTRECRFHITPSCSGLSVSTYFWPKMQKTASKLLFYKQKILVHKWMQFCAPLF